MAVDTRADSTDVAVADHAQLYTRNSGDSSRRRGGAAIREVPQATAGEPPNKNAIVDASSSNVGATTGQLQTTIAQFIETVEVQTCIVMLVVFDLCATVLTSYLRTTHELVRLEGLVPRTATSASSKASAPIVDLPVTTTTPSLLSVVILRVLDSLSGFTIVLFCIELAVLLFTYRRRFFTHVGYVLDAAVVCVSAAVEVFSDSQGLLHYGLLT
jgi:hypothetical protein